MRLRHLTLLLALVAMGLLLQQLRLYQKQRDTLDMQRGEASTLRFQIESAMYEEAQLLEQRHQAEQLNTRLRQLLPTSLQLEELEQTVATLAVKYQLKIVASRTAVISRPQYSEASVNITLEGKATALQRFTRELKAIPRRIHIVTPEKLGRKHHPLSLYIYAVTMDSSPSPPIPACNDMPSGVWLMPLQERLERHFRGYLEQCRFVTDYAHVYQQQQALQALQAENARLAPIEQRLRKRP